MMKVTRRRINGHIHQGYAVDSAGMADAVSAATGYITARTNTKQRKQAVNHLNVCVISLVSFLSSGSNHLQAAEWRLGQRPDTV
jgi:hypothetical protein